MRAKEHRDLSPLQQRISLLPRELQDHILLMLIELCLKPGKVFLHHGSDWPFSEPTWPIKFAGVDQSIFFALNRRWSSVARGIFYEQNDWVID